MVRKYICNICGSNDALAVYLALRDIKGKRFVKYRRLPFDLCLPCWDKRPDIIPFNFEEAEEQ